MNVLQGFESSTSTMSKENDDAKLCIIDDDSDLHTIEHDDKLTIDNGTPQDAVSANATSFATLRDEFHRNRKKFIVFAVLLVVLVLVGIIVGCTLGINNESDESGNDMVSEGLDNNTGSDEWNSDMGSGASNNDTGSDELDYSPLPAYSLEIARRDPNSPQAKALAWLIRTSKQYNYEPYRLQQRYALAVFYFSTNIVDFSYDLSEEDNTTWIKNDGWLVDPDECAWWSNASSGAPWADLYEPILYDQCTPDRRYIGLSVPYNGLTGTLPRELELLSDLKVLSLEDGLRGATPTEM
jgi:hypothetical protein